MTALPRVGATHKQFRHLGRGVPEQSEISEPNRLRSVPSSVHLKSRLGRSLPKPLRYLSAVDDQEKVDGPVCPNRLPEIQTASTEPAHHAAFANDLSAARRRSPPRQPIQ